MEGSYDHLVKLVLVGTASVGKSALLTNYCEHRFEDEMQATIGVDFKVALIDVDDKRVKATIWDTAGQERFRTLTSSYYRGAHGLIFVYDVTSRSTYDALDGWLAEAQKHCPGGADSVVKLLVGNKIDLEDERQVSHEDGKAWAQDHGMMFLETSAKSSVGVQSVFEELARKIIANPPLAAATATYFQPADDVQLGNRGAGGGSSSSGCC